MAEGDRRRHHRAQLDSKCLVHARLMLAEPVVADTRHFYWREARLCIRPPGWSGPCM